MKRRYLFPDPWPERGVALDKFNLPPGTPFGKRLRAVRSARGYSQAALGGRAGLAQQFIGRLERGDHDPTLSTLQKLAEGLNVSVGDLTGQKPIGGADLFADLLDALEKATKVTAILLELERVRESEVREVADAS